MYQNGETKMGGEADTVTVCPAKVGNGPFAAREIAAAMSS